MIWRWPARSDNLHAKGVAVNHHQAMMPPLHFSAASPSHQEQQPTKTQLRVAAPPIAPSAEKPTDRGINHDRRITNFPITPSSDHHTHFPQSAIRNPSIPSTNHPSLHNPTRDPKKKGRHPNSRITRTRRTRLGRRKRQIEQIPNQPQNIQYTQHPQRSHEFVGGRAPGDAPDQTAAIGTFDGAATRRRSGWHLAVGVDCGCGGEGVC